MQGLRPYALPLLAAAVLLVLFIARASCGEAAPVADTGADPGTKRHAQATDPATPSPDRSERPQRPNNAEATRADHAGPKLDVGDEHSRGGPPSPARVRRNALRKRIAEAARRSPTHDGGLMPEPPKLDKDYIRTRINDDLLPIAKECYDSALQDDAELAGRLTLQFTIVGADDVGGIVEEVQLANDSQIEHAALIECMTESMMSVTFEPPPGDGAVTVTYPFVFAAKGASQ